MAQIVPLSPLNNQTFTVPLNINGGTVQLSLFLYYNSMGGYWVMNISDQTGNPLVYGAPLLTGVWPAANILAPYQYLNIGSAFVINAGNSTNDYPSNAANDLGTNFLLLWDDNTGYVAGEPWGTSVIGPAGPPGPQGPPGPAGGIAGFYGMGTIGSLTPNMPSGYVQGTGTLGGIVPGVLTGIASIAAPASPVALAWFAIQIVQPATAPTYNVTFASFYRGLSSFILDTTPNTQAVLVFQVSSDGTYAQLMQIAANGMPLA